MIMQQNQKLFSMLERVVFLKKAPIFSGVDTSELRAIAHIVQEVSFEEGQAVFLENEIGETMYLIRSGSVNVIKNFRKKGEVCLATLSQGDCFGDMSVFDAEVRSASIVAASPCVLYQIGAEELMEVLLDSPVTAVRFIQVFVNRVRAANEKIQQLTLMQGEKQ